MRSAWHIIVLWVISHYAFEQNKQINWIKLWDHCETEKVKTPVNIKLPHKRMFIAFTLWISHSCRMENIDYSMQPANLESINFHRRRLTLTPKHLDLFRIHTSTIKETWPQKYSVHAPKCSATHASCINTGVFFLCSTSQANGLTIDSHRNDHHICFSSIACNCIDTILQLHVRSIVFYHVS